MFIYDKELSDKLTKEYKRNMENQPKISFEKDLEENFICIYDSELNMT